MRSHGTGPKMCETVTLTGTIWKWFLNGARWKRNSSRCRVNTKYVTFWLHFSAFAFLKSLRFKWTHANLSINFNDFVWIHESCRYFLVPESCEHTSLKSTSYNRTQVVYSAVLSTTSFSDKWLHSRAVSQSFTPGVLSIDLFREFHFDCVLKTGISLKQEEILTRRIC